MNPEDERYMDTLANLYRRWKEGLPDGIEVLMHDTKDRTCEAYHAVIGKRLIAGDTLEADDVYNSTSGRWDRCPCPGVTLGGVSDKVMWIRPWWPETVK